MKGSKAQLFLDDIVTNYINKKMPLKATRKTSSSLMNPANSPIIVKGSMPGSRLVPNRCPLPAENQ